MSPHQAQFCTKLVLSCSVCAYLWSQSHTLQFNLVSKRCRTKATLSVIKNKKDQSRRKPQHLAKLSTNTYSKSKKPLRGKVSRADFPKRIEELKIMFCSNKEAEFQKLGNLQFSGSKSYEVNLVFRFNNWSLATMKSENSSEPWICSIQLAANGTFCNIYW